MKVEDTLDHIPIKIEAILRGRRVFSINLPLQRMSKSEIQTLLVQAFEQLSDPEVVRGLSKQIMNIVRETEN